MKLKDLFGNTFKNQDLHEMTILSGDINYNSQIRAMFEYLEKHGKHTGDIEGYSIYMASYGTDIFYGVFLDNQIVSAINFRKKQTAERNMLEIGVAFTKEEHRGNNLSHRILYFIKHHENMPMIDYGSNTVAAIRSIKSLAQTGRFKMHWYNIETGEIEEYDHKTDTHNPSKYRDPFQQTNWRLILENDNAKEGINKFPRFDGKMFVRPYVLFPFKKI